MLNMSLLHPDGRKRSPYVADFLLRSSTVCTNSCTAWRSIWSS